MWSSWLSSSRRNKTTARVSSLYHRTRSSSSSCHFSFKDINTLLQIEPEPEPDSPRSPTLIRRQSLSSSRFIPHTIPSTTTTLPSKFDHGSVVVYYTSLHVIRSTSNDCRAVRSILRRFAVAIDERDVCVDEQFRDELMEILGRRNVQLPCVFIGGEYIGGADDVRRLYDSGELQEMIERLPELQSQPINACGLCGGLRFVVCDECNGSRKIFAGKINGFRACLSCNTNGLMRCHACFIELPRHTK